MMFKLSISRTVTLGRTKKSNVESELRVWQDQTTKVLHQIPGKVKYPIRWTSERQRKAFFASDGFGRGIPTRRTGAVAKWDVFVDYKEINAIEEFTRRLSAFMADLNPFRTQSSPSIPKGKVVIAMTNEVPYQRYVTGVNQQGFHADTGWLHLPTVTVVQLKKAEGIIQGL